MPALLMATMLIAAGQDVSTLRVPPPPTRSGSVPWNRPWPLDLCPRPVRGQTVLFNDLPAEVLADLRHTDPLMSPPGGPFNAGDAVDNDTPQTRAPQTRVIAALRVGDRLAVAYEKGGWGRSVTIHTYALRPATGRFTIQDVNLVPPDMLKQAPGAANPACAALERTLASLPSPHP